MNGKINLKNIITGIAAAGMLLFIGSLVAYGGWTDPTQTPPGGNVAAPINVSATGQQKAGGLALNSSGAATALALLGNGSLDISGLIRIVDSTGINVIDAGQATDVLTHTGTGMEWRSPEKACTSIAQTTVAGTGGVTVNVPLTCKNEPCTLILAQYGPAATVDRLRATEYVQFTSQSAFNSQSYDWWVKTGSGGSGTTCTTGKNGTGAGCDGILSFAGNSRLQDDNASIEIPLNPDQWSLTDASPNDSLELIVCN